jgi:hypothetical protein
MTQVRHTTTPARCAQTAAASHWASRVRLNEFGVTVLKFSRRRQQRAGRR